MCIYHAHVHAPLSHWTSLTKHKFKDEIIKNFKVSDGRALNQLCDPPEHGTLCDHRGHTHVKLTLYTKNKQISTERIHIPTT